MAHNEAVATARETAIGDEGNLLTQPFTHNCRRWAEHFAHARRTARPLISNNKDVARDDCAVEHAGETLLFRIVDAGVARKRHAFFTGDFSDRTTRRKIATQHTQVAVFFDWIVEWANDVLAVGVGLHVRKVFGKSLACNRHTASIKHASIKHGFHKWLDTAYLD